MSDEPIRDEDDATLLGREEIAAMLPPPWTDDGVVTDV